MSTAIASERLTARIEEIRSRQGNMIPLEDIGEIVTSLVATIDGNTFAVNDVLREELHDLVLQVQAARAELAVLQPARIREDHIAPAADELDAVVQATEEAANVFLDSAEQLESLAAGPLDEATAGKLTEIAIGIYEAANFQDITGQRITKVAAALSHIETKIATLASLADGVPVKVAAPADEDQNHELLSGPALPDQANSQDDIDALLASFD